MILGKTNLSEWANFRSTHSTSGWSGRGGQARNPYALDRTPCGSSSGSAAAVAASYRAGRGRHRDRRLDPLPCRGQRHRRHQADRRPGQPRGHHPHRAQPGHRRADGAHRRGRGGRCSAPSPEPTRATRRRSSGAAATDYTAFLDADGLRGARIGVAARCLLRLQRARRTRWARTRLAAMRDAGRRPRRPRRASRPPATWRAATADDSAVVLLYEFKADLNAYLAALGRTRRGRSLDDLIAFNQSHRRPARCPTSARSCSSRPQQTGPLTDDAYRTALARTTGCRAPRASTRSMAKHGLDALVMPTTARPGRSTSSTATPVLGNSARAAAMAGYPTISVPAGHVFGLPVGFTFFGRAGDEPTLIRLAYAFEQATRARRPPKFLRPSVLPRG